MIKKIAGLGLIVASIFIVVFVSSNDDKVVDASVSTAAENKTQLAQDDQVLTTTAGRTAYIDPETGQLTSRPSIPIDNQAAIQAELNLPPVQYTTYANGTVGAALNGRFRAPLIATIACDGKIKTEHSNELASKTEKCEVEK